jgi:hypoxanthine-DNA glycosylase
LGKRKKAARRLNGFKPIADRRSRILILGSFPGAASLKKKQYYGHKQNHFWRILSDILGKDVTHSAYAEKIRLLRENGIALWDVISSCRRKGSSDTNIRTAQTSDITALLARYPNIKKICFNGQAAKRIFLRNNTLRIETACLPSTSPAHTAPYAGKKNAWRGEIRDLLKAHAGL